MGNYIPNQISFEDVQFAQHTHLIISTLPSSRQQLLIENTIDCNKEIQAVEHAIKHKKPIIVYGLNCNDQTIYKKYDQIKKLGGNVFLYTGGLFEWMLLQDIYGTTHFRTTSKTNDLLQFKPDNVLNTKYITY
jgi:hypothetical protein